MIRDGSRPPIVVIVDLLTPEQARVLGCLIEKQMTTPEYYPMTVNALVSAANQKTNRDPVMSLDDESVEAAIAGLTERGLARFTRAPGARTLKYVHKSPDVLEIDDEQTALVGVLLLRGPQTPGELRSRTDRYVAFSDVATVEQTLTDLITRDVPLVERLDREPGRKEHRYRTLLSEWSGGAVVAATNRDPDLLGRISALEERVLRLETELGFDPRSEDV